MKYVAELDEPVTPIGDRVLIRPQAPPTKVGLIHVPDEAQERMAKEEPYAVVVKVGPGMLTKSGGRWPIEVHEGDTVIYDPKVVDAATEVTIRGARHLVVWSSALLAVREAA